jgi:two-component system LytT family sensor kinase
MTFLKPVVLWLTLTFFFSLANNSFRPSDMLIQAVNSLLFTIGYYFSYRFLIKGLLYRKKTSRFVVLYLLTIACLSFISLVTVYEIYVFQQKKFYVDNYWSGPVFIVSNYILVLLVTSTLLSFRFLKDKMDTQARLETLEKEKISTELEFLKAQINPHFLFNSLNNILFQIDKTNTIARDTLLKFSAMLRYQLYECSSDLVPIEEELQYLKNYIEIQMLRKTDKYDCRLRIADSVKNFSIAPLLLIPFVENAFKHVSHYAQQSNIIYITMDYTEGIFSFSARNSKDNTKRTRIDENGGIGLANVKRRLNLLYEGKHQLEITNGNEEFNVRLQMKVNRAHYHEEAELHRN